MDIFTIDYKCQTARDGSSGNPIAVAHSYCYKQKIFSKKQNGFRDGLSYSTPQKSEETRGNANTQPRSKKNVEFRDGMDRGWVMAFPLVSSLF